jgi:hypothetical protein
LAEWIANGEAATSIRTKLNDAKITTDGKGDVTTYSSLSNTASGKADLVGGKISYSQLPKTIHLDSYMAFCANVNTASLDLAFGKYNSNMKNLGQQLAMWGWFQGVSTSTPELLTMCNYDTFTQICGNSTLKNYLINTSLYYSFIQTSPYAYNILNNTPIGLPDIVLYDSGASTYFNLPGTATDLTSYSEAGGKLSLVKTVTDSANYYSGSALYSLKTAFPAYPFKGYKNINIRYATSPLTSIDGGYRGAALSLALGGTGVPINWTSSGVATHDNFDLFTTLTNVTSMEIGIGTSAFNAGQTYTAQAYIEKIWISEV